MAVQIAGPRNDGGDARPYVVALDLCGVTDPHPVHVGDGIERTGFENPYLYSQIPGPGAFFIRLHGLMQQGESKEKSQPSAH